MTCQTYDTCCRSYSFQASFVSASTFKSCFRLNDNVANFTTSTGNANTQDYTSTIVVYNDDSHQKGANAIVSALGCGSAVKNDGSYTVSGKFLVVLGSDYSG